LGILDRVTLRERNARNLVLTSPCISRASPTNFIPTTTSNHNVIPPEPINTGHHVIAEINSARLSTADNNRDLHVPPQCLDPPRQSRHRASPIRLFEADTANTLSTSIRPSLATSSLCTLPALPTRASHLAPQSPSRQLQSRSLKTLNSCRCCGEYSGSTRPRTHRCKPMRYNSRLRLRHRF
jgi:hypothetical protein